MSHPDHPDAATAGAGALDGRPEGSFDQAKLAAARLWATNRFPYLASAVFAAPTLPAPGVGRLMVDRWWRIHADPLTVDRATVAELGGELLHLTAHLLRDHAGRADNQRFERPAELHHWVDAADAEIADDFPNDLERVSPSVRPEDLGCPESRLAEEYYRQGEVRQGEVGEDNLNKGAVSGGEAVSEGLRNDCGSGAHGHSPEWEPPPPQRKSDQGVSEDDQRMIRRRVAADVEQAGADASAALRRWARDEIAPTVNWRAELAASIRRSISSVSGAVDYSYRRPSRRALSSTGVVMPSLQRPTVEVTVICDTSASVSDEQLGAAMAEVDGLLRATGTRSVTVLSCDDAVQTVSRASNGRAVTLIGGGGTDMAVGIDAAMEQRPRPQLLVVLTDGYTPWPATAPHASVVVGLLGDGVDGAVPPVQPPAWATTVTIGP